MQLSVFVGIPLVVFIGTAMGQSLETMAVFAGPFWIVFSFSVTLIVVLLLLRGEMKAGADLRAAATLPVSILWAIFGVFLALFAQTVAANIEVALGIEVGSENT